MDVNLTLGLHAEHRELVVASVQEVVWISDLPTIIEVWVNVDSVTFVGELLFALVTWKLKAFRNPFAGVGWAATDSWLVFNQIVPVVTVFLGGASSLVWNDTFKALTSLLLTATAFVHVSSPNINLVGIAWKVVDHWTLAVAWCALSSPAATVMVIKGGFGWVTWSEISLVSNANATRLVFLFPSVKSKASDRLALIDWVAFDSVDWFTFAVWWWWVTSFFVLLEAGMATSQSIAITLNGSDACAFTSVTVIVMLVKDLASGVDSTVNVALGGVTLWWTVLTSLVGVVHSVSIGELGQEEGALDWVDTDGSVVVGVIAIASTTKTESALGVGGTVADRPLLVFWVVFNTELKLGQVESDIRALLGGRVTGLVGDVVFGGKVEDFSVILGENVVVGKNVNVTVDVVLDSEGFDGFLKVHDNLKVHVAGVVGESMSASIACKQVVSLTVISGNHVVSGSRTSASALTTDVASATLTSGSISWNKGSLLTIWTVWLGSSANMWVTLVDAFGQALASLASIGNMWEGNANSVNLTIVLATTVLFNVLWATGFRILNLHQLLAVDALVSAGWWEAKVWLANTDWLGATGTVVLPIELEALDGAGNHTSLEDGWLIASGWVTDATASIAASTELSSSGGDVAEFGASVSSTSVTTWSWSTLDSAEFTAILGLNAFTIVATFVPDCAATVGLFGEWVLTELLVDFASFATSSWHDHSGETLTASNLLAWLGKALLETVDALTGFAVSLPGVTGWIENSIDLAWALTKLDHSLTVAHQVLAANSSSHITNRHSALANIGDAWTSWDLAIASTAIARVAALFSTVTVTKDSLWLAESTTAALKVLAGEWRALFRVANTDKVWADAAVFVLSVESNDLFVGLAAWLFKLLASVDALVLDTFISEAAFVASVSQESLVAGAAWNLHAKSTSIVASNDAVFKARAGVASVLKMVPLFAQSSGAAGLVNALWWWGWSVWSWGTWRCSGGAVVAFTIRNHLLAGWTTALVLTAPLSPGDWSTAWLTGTFVGTGGWRVTLADLLVAWFAVSEIVADDGVDLHSWALASHVLLWWASNRVTHSLVATSDGVVGIVGSVTFLAGGELFNGSSALTGIVISVLVELVLTIDEGTDVPTLLADGGVVELIDDSGKWNDSTLMLATFWRWSTRLENLAATTTVNLVDSNVVWWTLLNLALGFWNTLTVLFEAWAAWGSLVRLSLFLHLAGASVTSDCLLEWTANVIAAVLTSSLSAATVKGVLVAKADSLAVLEFGTNGWHVLDCWDLTGDVENTLVFVASVFTGPFVADWVLNAVVLAHGLDTIVVTDTRGVALALILGILGWTAAQVMAAWSTDWSLFDALSTEVTSDDLALAGTLGSLAFDIIVEDHIARLHSDTGVVASGSGLALFETWELEAFGAVGWTAFASSSSDTVSLSRWTSWWVFNAQSFVALALVPSAAAFVVSIEANIVELNKLLALTSTSWNGVLGALFGEVWDKGGASGWRWAFPGGATGILVHDESVTVSASWLALLSTWFPKILASNVSALVAATWLAFIAFLMDNVTNIVVLALVLANVASTGTGVAQATALVSSFTEDTVLLVTTNWSNGDWAIVTSTSVLWATIELLSLVGNGMKEVTGWLWTLAGWTGWDEWMSQNFVTLGDWWALDRNTSVNGTALGGRDEFPSLSVLIASDLWSTVWRLSEVLASGRSVFATNTWLANITVIPFIASIVYNTIDLANAALASLVLATALVSVSGLGTSSLALFMFTLLLQQSALGSVANTALLSAALIESLAF